MSLRTDVCVCVSNLEKTKKLLCKLKAYFFHLCNNKISNNITSTAVLFLLLVKPAYDFFNIYKTGKKIKFEHGLFTALNINTVIKCSHLFLCLLMRDKKKV